MDDGAVCLTLSGSRFVDLNQSAAGLLQALVESAWSIDALEAHLISQYDLLDARGVASNLIETLKSEGLTS